MKIALSRKQITQWSFVVILFLSSLVLGWLGLGRLAEKSDLARQLADRKGQSELAELLGTPGGLGSAKKEALQLEQLSAELAKKEQEFLGPWREATQVARGQEKEWAKDPNKWKDQLVKWNDEILKRSAKTEKAKSVLLITNFYLGLEEFKQKSPREEQVPELALQLSVSKRLVDLLFKAKETAVEGYPTSCTLLKLQGPLSPLGEPVPETKEKGGVKGALKRDRYLMDLACSPEVLFAFMNALTTDAYFFIPIDLTLTNEKEGFPRRSELAGQFSPPSQGETPPPDSPRGENKAPASPLLKILAGDEKLRISLQIDFVRLGLVEGPKSANKPNR